MEDLKSVVDHAGVLTLFAVFAEWLPIAVSALAFVWYSIRIYDYFKHKRLN